MTDRVLPELGFSGTSDTQKHTHSVTITVTHLQRYHCSNLYIVFTQLNFSWVFFRFFKVDQIHHYIFSVNDQGDLTLDDLDHLNTTETHLVAVAKDSGSPPRETSVPVLIRFGEDLFARYQTSTRDPDHEKFTLTVVLGLLLTVFLIIILGLVGKK